MIQKKVVFLLSIILVFAFLILGCKSTPEPESPPPVSDPVIEVKPEPIVPAEPEPVPEPEPEPVKPDFSNENAELVTQIKDAKQKADEVGAKDAFTKEYESLTASYEEAKKTYDAGGDSEAFNINAKETLLKYQALEKATLAKNYKAKIDSLDFAKYNTEKYASGESNLNKVSSLFEQNASATEIFAASESAYNDLYTVYKDGYTEICNAKKLAIADVKKQADELKANKGDKEGYSAATSLYNAAETDFSKELYESAFKGYESTFVAFSGVYERVLEKRKKAEEAIARAKEKTQKIHQFAQEADTIAPLPGIDEESEPAETPSEAATSTDSVDTALKTVDATVQEVVKDSLELIIETTTEAVEEAVEEVNAK